MANAPSNAPAAPTNAPDAAVDAESMEAPDATGWGAFDATMLREMAVTGPVVSPTAPTDPLCVHRYCYRCNELSHTWKRCPLTPLAHLGRLSATVYRQALREARDAGGHANSARRGHQRNSHERRLRRSDKAVAAADTAPTPAAAAEHAGAASAARQLLAQCRMKAADDAADDRRGCSPSANTSQAAARLRAEATACTIRATLAQNDADALVLAQECAHDAVASRVRSSFSPPTDDLHCCRRSLQPTTA